MQRECYNDIADGARIKGWLMIGRGLRFLRGVELIDGCAKEDIRWDELQHEGGKMRMVAFWFAVGILTIMLGIGSECSSACRIHPSHLFFSDCRGGLVGGKRTRVRSLLPILPPSIVW